MFTLSGVGKVVKDPEIRDAGDTKAATISIVSNKGYKKKGSDEWTNVGTFVELKCFGYLAENADKHVKGTWVEFAGEVEQESWEDKETGKNRSKLVVKPFIIRKFSGKQAESDSGSGNVPEDDSVPF